MTARTNAFALGLTNPSPTANKDEHKQVMEEKSRHWITNWLKAQKDLSRQNHADGRIKQQKRH
jgi:hypothetical protein